MEPLTAEDLAAPPFGEFYKEATVSKWSLAALASHHEPHLLLPDLSAGRYVEQPVLTDAQIEMNGIFQECEVEYKLLMALPNYDQLETSVRFARHVTTSTGSSSESSAVSTEEQRRPNVFRRAFKAYQSPMENLTESDGILANSVWVSTGILGCFLNLTLFIIILMNTAKGFYRTLTLAIALVDFCCSLSGIFQATWYYKVDNILYCVDHGVSNNFPDWTVQVIWIAWVVTFYGELIVITYSFVWRAVLISNSRIVRMFEHKIIFVLLAIISCAIGYCDYSIECSVEYVNLTPLETLQIVLPAILSGLNFVVIASCALFIHYKIKRGSFSKKMKSTHKKRLFVLSIQAVNPLFLNFIVDLIYELALIAPIPDFLVSYIPCSSFHPALNALIILLMTSEHRSFIGNLCRPNMRSSST
ncbi:hypothetical protein PRIPAC_96935, partial [Pristionchus pacificus]|uniref:G protein-coupled receptor n=1 Tax=Pristionchus pacificus TaxID=54126 RepID=A0A2A6BK42_PRIPA